MAPRIAPWIARLVRACRLAVASDRVPLYAVASCGAALCTVAPPRAVHAQVSVVNVIPLRMSGETAANPEPTIAVNPVNPDHIVVAAIVPGDEFCAPGGRAPLFISMSGGRRWSYACVIPRLPGDMSPFDLAFRYGPDGVLYGALLSRLDSLTLRVVESVRPVGPAPMRIMFERNHVDQPWIEAQGVHDTVAVIVSGNDKSLAMVDTVKGTGAFFISSGALRTGLLFRATPVEHRTITGQNYAIRVAGHRDGTVYAVYYSPRGAEGEQLDVVVARDDSAGRGVTAFDELHDLTPGGLRTSGPRCDDRDGRVGFRVARCRALPFQTAHDSVFGQERRVGANLSIAVDPRASRTVYVAWADSVEGSNYMLHVRRSLDGGRQWSGDLLTIPNATNPALAIDSAGTVGFAYQQLSGTGRDTRWVTRLLLTGDAFRTVRSFTLAAVPARRPLGYILPYIGDYMQLVAVGRTFYGAFSSANTPDRDHFPNGVVYQRRADFAAHRLLDLSGQRISGVSIDPFFFRVGPAESAACPALRITARAQRRSVAASAARARMGIIGCRGMPLP